MSNDDLTRIDAELEAGNTWSAFPTATALTVALLAAQYGYTAEETVSVRSTTNTEISFEGSPGSAQMSRVESATDLDLLQALHRVHQLLSHQETLDDDARKVLVENLWDLYE